MANWVEKMYGAFLDEKGVKKQKKKEEKKSEEVCKSCNGTGRITLFNLNHKCTDCDN